jgi:hypothetical protein
VASLRKELPHAADGGPEGTLAGVARWVGETETSFRDHFAAWKEPELFSEELWVVFRSLR